MISEEQKARWQKEAEQQRQERERIIAYQRERTLVYFIQPEGGGPIKIGSSYRPLDRVRAVQPHSPYRMVLLAVIPGSRRLELEIHARFQAQRLHNEWFTPCPELLALIDAHRVPTCALCGYLTEAGQEQCAECAAWPRERNNRGREEFVRWYHPALHRKAVAS